VLVADFDNTTGDADFEGAIEQSLAIGLDGAPYLSVFKRPNARRLAGELDADSEGLLDSRLARLVSRSEGINIVIEGSVEGSQGDYRVSATALDAATFDEIAAATSRFDSKAEFNRAVYEVAGELISDLGAAPTESADAFSLETFTTSSLEAMNAYARAQELVAQGRDEEAIAAYGEAIQADPEFGRAYSGLATVYFNRGERAKGQEYYAQAMAHIDRMSERERRRTRGVYYLMNADFENAIGEYSALVERYPADGAGFVNLALAHFYSRNLDLAVEVGRQSVELIPNSIDPRYNLTWYSLMAGEFDLAEQEAGVLVDQYPDFDQTYLPLAMAHLMAGRPVEEVRQTYRRMSEISDWGATVSVTGLADLALYEGLSGEAEELLRPGIEADSVAGRGDLCSRKQIILAESLLAQGRTEESLVAVAAAVAGSDEVAVLYGAARLRIAAGEFESALEIAAGLGEQVHPEPRAFGKLIEGEASLQAGEPQLAIRQFREAQELLDTWIGHLALARAYLAAEAYVEAHGEVEICLERRGEATSAFFNDCPTLRYIPQVDYYLGRALEGMGSPAAADAYRTFLDVKAAGAADPLVADARQRLADL
jgi:tetratricopeptide (TPR) repeat protein